ncbi:alpha/beta hydrolase [Salinibacterium sp. ZJ454]|uniref:alpha/beta fold hydrolase n=1 Tax=Salinibacterium sp. ZJ454 TaxID=2708339 RepID=UPI00142483DF|nr:alpha/beta hydrolase [Salinibacterium sp. ZJ454]
MSIRRSELAVGDHVFRLNETGDPGNETVLFLHGSGPGATGLSNWEQIIGDLGDTFHCVAPDMIGFGDSSHPLDPPQGMGPFNELRAEALLGLLDALDLDRVHLVGNSMGGQLALLMVLAAPDRIGKVMLMGSGGAPTSTVSPGLQHLREFYAEPSETSLRDLLSEFVYEPALLAGRIDAVAADRMAYVERADVARSHRASFNPTGARRIFTPDELAGIDHDVLVIHGRDDRIIPLEASHYFAKHLPNANLYVIGRCGHWTQIEHPQKFETLLTRFIAGIV